MLWQVQKCSNLKDMVEKTPVRQNHPVIAKLYSPCREKMTDEEQLLSVTTKVSPWCFIKKALVFYNRKANMFEQQRKDVIVRAA